MWASSCEDLLPPAVNNGSRIQGNMSHVAIIIIQICHIGIEMYYFNVCVIH